MGLLDSMFGGGTKLELFLDTTTASPGSVVGGRIVLHGGQKPLRTTEVCARLMLVHTQTREGQTLPDVDLRELTKQVVAANGQLAPGSQQAYTFRLTVPTGNPLSAHNVGYKVVASADIPGIKDPNAAEDIQVVEKDDHEGRRLPLEEIVARWPDLHSQDEERLCSALYELFLACYSEGASLMEAEQLLAWHLQHGTVRVRRRALEAWANLVDNRVRPEHVHTLYGVLNTPGLDGDTMEQVVIAATKFAEEGTLTLVQQLAQSPDPTIRASVANNLRFNAADKFNGKRELLVQLAQDPASNVRKAAVSAFTDFRDDQQIMYWVANLADSDPDVEVKAECISSLSLAHYHGMGELTLAVYEKHVVSPSEEVREAVARGLGSQPASALQRLWGIAQRLAQDPSDDVRWRLAFEFCNMSDLPQFLPICQHMAQQDPSARVRKEALESMSALMPPAHAVAFYGGMMQQARSEEELWTVLSGLRRHSDHGDTKRLLSQLGQCQFPAVANAAREAMSY